MMTPEETAQPMIMVNRDTPAQPSIDHNFIACLECRFKGTWSSDSAGHYVAVGEAAELRLVRIDGFKKYLAFKSGAHVTVFFQNVLSYEQTDVEEEVDITGDH